LDNQNLFFSEKELAIIYEALLYYLEEAELPEQISENDIELLIQKIISFS